MPLLPKRTTPLLGGEAERELKDRLEVQQILSLAGGGTHLLGSARMDYRASYSYAEESEPKARYPVFVTEDLSFNVDTSDPDRPRYSETTGGLQNYGAYGFDEYELNDNMTTDRDFTAALDFTLPYRLGELPASFKFGGKARIKHKDREDRVTVYDGFDGTYTLTDVLGSFEDTDYYQDCAGCYAVGKIADPKRSWEFFRTNQSAFELDSDKTNENGIAVVGDLLLVVERDNHRVQVLTLPEFQPLGAFGEEDLIRPYGITCVPEGEDVLEVYITDDYGNEVDLPEGQDPTGDFTRRVKQFTLRTSDGAVEAELVRAFGEARGPGALSVVESIQADPDQGILLIADEHDFDLEVHGLSGTYKGQTVGRGLYGFGDPEGIMLYRCGAQGYWVLTDQGETRTVLHVLERGSFRCLEASLVKSRPTRTGSGSSNGRSPDWDGGPSSLCTTTGDSQRSRGRTWPVPWVCVEVASRRVREAPPARALGAIALEGGEGQPP